MKKIILLASLIMMIGCNIDHNPKETDSYSILIMDSCEYIVHYDHYGFQHKGNCRFCKERRQQEIKDIIKAQKGE